MEQKSFGKQRLQGDFQPLQESSRGPLERSTRKESFSEMQAKKADQRLAEIKREEAENGVNLLSGGINSRKFLNEVAKREERIRLLKFFDHLISSETPYRRDLIHDFARQARTFIAQLREFPTFQVEDNLNMTRKKFDSYLNNTNIRINNHQHRAINGKTAYDRNIAYRNLAGTYNELKRNRWKIEKADKREDKGKIPRKTLEDAYIVFETSSESNPEAYHTIAFATREELNRIEKILGPDHYSLQDVYGKYGKSLQAVTENLMQYDTRRMIKQDEREAMITAFIQGSQQVFQLGERVDASSRQDEISSVPPKSTQERSEGLGQLAHLPNEPGSRDWKPEPIDWSKWDL